MAYKRHTITNGQYVSIEQTPASIGHRMVATIADGVILFLYSSVFSIVIAVLEGGSSDIFKVLVLAVFLLIPVLYDPVMEQLFGGSIGKLVCGMRVVMQNGESVSIGSSILRRLLYTIDSIGGLGFVVMLCNKKNMRLGDLAAGTIVVKAKTNYKVMLDLRTFTHLKPGYQPEYPWAADLTWGQVFFITETMQKIHETGYRKNQRENIKLLGKKLAEKYHVSGLKDSDYNLFLRRIVSDYNYYTWQDEL